jgi:hypothetical protein
MTEIDLLKRVRDDVADPDPFVLARARRRLLTPPPVRRRAAQARVLVVGGLALTLAGGFLAADVVSQNSTPLPGMTADAGTFLADAATMTNSNPDAPIPPGQFRQISIQMSRIDPFGTNPRLRATVLTRFDRWIPAAPTTQHLTQVTENVKVDFATPEAREAARTQAPYLFERPRPKFNLTACSGFVSVAKSSRLPTPLCKPSWRVPTADFLARQPRDPDALLAALRNDSAWGGAGMEPDRRAFLNLSTALDSGFVPADLRAALYQAARKIPGIQLLGEVVTLDGRRGRAIGLTENGYRQDIIISDSNGEYVGYRMVVTQDGPGPINGGPGHPTKALRPGDIVYSSSVTSRITPTSPAAK